MSESNTIVINTHPIKKITLCLEGKDIGVTLNTYTYLTFDDAKEEMERLSKAQ